MQRKFFFSLKGIHPALQELINWMGRQEKHTWKNESKTGREISAIRNKCFQRRNSGSLGCQGGLQAGPRGMNWNWHR